MTSIVVIIPYFGIWPAWFDLFLESCKWNSSITWLFYTDCGGRKEVGVNIRFTHVTFEEYCRKVSQQLKINFRPENPINYVILNPPMDLFMKRISMPMIMLDSVILMSFMGISEILLQKKF
jgi:hypothetical protein